MNAPDFVCPADILPSNSPWLNQLTSRFCQPGCNLPVKFVSNSVSRIIKHKIYNILNETIANHNCGESFLPRTCGNHKRPLAKLRIFRGTAEGAATTAVRDRYAG